MLNFRTPRGRATALGSAGTGAHHWWAHRVTAVALVPLTVLAIPPFARTLGAGHDAVIATYSNPFNAIVAVLFLAMLFRHLSQGLEVVIEDYAHNRIWRTGLLLGNAMFCGAFGVTGIFAVLKIAFTG